jgi:DsbC/DsbD-like thiol-disulfide interchange protein
MKKMLTLIAFTLSVAFVQAQNPVSWAFKAKKLADKSYEVSLTATVQSGWHIYSMTQKGEIGVPTSFTFTNNALFTLDGKTTSKAKITKGKDPSTNQVVEYYSGTVTFVQKVKLKANVKTSFAGSVEFMSCDDKKCLPPKSLPFTVALQ